MGYARVFLWVEGADDERFIESIVRPMLEERYDCVQTVSYAQESKKKMASYFHSIISMGADYIFFADNDSVCVTLDKERLCKKYRRLEENRIQIVVKEIEGWYLAGLIDDEYRDFGLDPIDTTDDITKEQFDDLIPGTFSSRIDFMLEALKRFASKVAVVRNKSFEYFVNKFVLSESSVP